MKNKLAAAIALATLAPLSTLADVIVYGKANVSLESVTIQDDTFTRVASNASRLGFKGSERVSDTLEAVYQLEYGVNFDSEVGDKVVSQRNTFVGLKGEFGTLLMGRMDTPTKSAQNNVDLFGDLPGDFAGMLSYGDYRANNTVSYTTPSMSGVSASVLYMSREQSGDLAGQGDGTSVSLSYTNDSVYLAAAFDSGIMLDTDTTRLVGQFTFGAIQLGILYESMSPDVGDSTDSSFVSVQYNVDSKWALKTQYGQGDQKFEGADTFSIGADYKYTKNCKTFAFYTMEGADDDVVDNTYAGVGIELKF